MKDYMHLREVRIKWQLPGASPDASRSPVDWPATLASRTHGNDEESDMIQLQSIEKVYRTDRIETVALADVNLTDRRRRVHLDHGAVRAAARARCST